MTRAAVVVLALGAGCNWSLHRMQHQSRCHVDGVTTLLPGGTCNLALPAGVVPYGPAPHPPAVTRALLERGRDRFERFCAPCHGVAGDGNSYVASVMQLRKPPSLVDAAAASLTDQRIRFVIAHGYGLMPSYATPLPSRDRYAVLYFLRAIQHREVALDHLPPKLAKEARRWLH